MFVDNYHYFKNKETRIILFQIIFTNILIENNLKKIYNYD